MSVPVSSPSSSTTSPPFFAENSRAQKKLESANKMKSTQENISHINHSFNETKNLCSLITSWVSIILKTGEYITNNKNNIIYTANLFSKKHKEKTKEVLKIIKNNYKTTEYSSHVLISSIVYFIANYFQKKIKQSQASLDQASLDTKNKKKLFHRPVEGMDSLYHKSKVIEKKLIENIEESRDKFIVKGVGLLLKKGASLLAHFSQISQDNAEDISKAALSLFKGVFEFFLYSKIDALRAQWTFHLESHFFVDLRYPDKNIPAYWISRDTTIANVKLFHQSIQKVSSQNEVDALYRELQLSWVPTVGKFKEYILNGRFVRDLSQHFYYTSHKRLDFTPTDIKDLLDRHKRKKEKQIAEAYPFIVTQLSSVQNLPFDTIKEHFSSLHISLPPCLTSAEAFLFRPAASVDEPKSSISREQLIRLLAESFVDYQITTNQQILQAMRQAILSKMEVERRLIQFHKIAKVVSLALTLFKLYLYVYDGNGASQAIITKYFFKDYSELISPFFGCFYLLSPLYPNLKFTTEALLFNVCEQIFAFKYKPCEYGIESYALDVEKKLQEMSLFVTDAYFYIIKKFRLWMSALFFNFFWRASAEQISQNTQALADLQEKHHTHQQAIHRRMEAIKNRRYQILLKETNRLIRTHIPHGGTEEEALEIIVQAIESIDEDYLSYDTLEFFENHLGISLKTDRDWKKKIEKFFTMKEEEFFKAFSKNRFRYLDPKITS